VPWLFTQVWLWSLAAFLLGSALTWLLFVRPLRRRLNAVISEYSNGFGYMDTGEDPDFARSPAADRALDLLEPASEQDQPPEDDKDEPTFGGWNRTARHRPQHEAPGSGLALEEPVTAEGTERGVPDRPFATMLTDPETPTVVESVPDAPRSEESEPEAEREADRQVPSADVESAEQPASSSTWFQKTALDDSPSSPEGGETDERPGADDRPPAPQDDPDSKLSGQLRSLFEAPATPDVGQDRGEPPNVSPVESGVTQNIPRVKDPAEQTPLPRRTPGAGPRPGVPKGGRSGSSSDGYMIKGHFASRQYHTPDSPQYERIVAEVWFRTVADAEQAGFEPWDARQQE
jgi:hypothetical protein